MGRLRLFLCLGILLLLCASTARLSLWRREVEQIKQVANRRSINRNIWVIWIDDGVGEIIPAPIADRTDAPVPLDELED
jgi:hypothetical protein